MSFEISNVGINEFLNVINKEIMKNSLKWKNLNNLIKKIIYTSLELNLKGRTLGSIRLRKQSKYLNGSNKMRKKNKSCFRFNEITYLLT